MMSAKDCVPTGGSFHARGGEMFFPVQAYFAGIDCPFVNASLVSSRDIFASFAGRSVAMGSEGVASVVGLVEDVHDVSRMDINNRQ
jgi:hypothetical protein